ncbi:hypothetical protein [Cesiribacter sp. SM1]|uniref:hypothetical protein n=1 Tax=Cesiribacter sp. SM1 TaxID=2861196 RepID=UPI001CD27453|nr:hypothetical protein [Cesiribacter sp. SM1]
MTLTQSLRFCLKLLPCFFLLAGCKSFSENAKYELNNGYYKAREEEGDDHRVYVYTNEDTLVAYRLVQQEGNRLIDTTGRAALVFPATNRGAIPTTYTLHEYSFDLDVLAIPMKYRPETAGVPRQLNTQFNGAIYAGYRTDRYRISYEPTPLGIADREINHYGYSVGYFTGIGVEPINPWVTHDLYAGEYDGIAWMNGVAVMIGINSFTFGLGVGIDQLLDANRNIWIYQGKPWLGLTLGLNLN